MSPEIINKLHTVLYSISPLASVREQIIGEMGETIWLETLEKILMSLPEDARVTVVELLNTNQLDKALEIVEAYNIDVDVILSEVATSVLDEVLVAGK